MVCVKILRQQGVQYIKGIDQKLVGDGGQVLENKDESGLVVVVVGEV